MWGMLCGMEGSIWPHRWFRCICTPPSSEGYLRTASLTRAASGLVGGSEPDSPERRGCVKPGGWIPAQPEEWPRTQDGTGRDRTDPGSHCEGERRFQVKSHDIIDRKEVSLWGRTKENHQIWCLRWMRYFFDHAPLLYLWVFRSGLFYCLIVLLLVIMIWYSSIMTCVKTVDLRLCNNKAT